MPKNPPGYRAPSAGFLKHELQTLARAGIRERVREIERELHRIQVSFPGLLISAEPIVLLAPEPRADGQAWPPLQPAAPPKAKRRLTPKALKAMRANAQKGRVARWKKTIGKPNGRPVVPVWQTMQAVLLAAPHHQATTADFKHALGRTDKAASVAIGNAAQLHTDVFKRVARGVYTLTAAGQKADAAAE